MLTLVDVKNECIRLSKSVGDTFSIPVLLNGRLTSTLGRCIVVWEQKKQCYRPTVIEISKRALEEISDDDMIDIIRHEWVHYYLAKTRPQEDHGHDRTFKALCRKVQCNGDAESTVTYKDCLSDYRHSKYTLVCPLCGDVAGYNRMCNTLRFADQVQHKTCGTKGMTYEVNW